MAHLRDVRTDLNPAVPAPEPSAEAIVVAETVAYARGLEDGLAQSNARVAEALSGAAEEVRSARAQWCSESREQLCKELKDGRARLEERLSEEIARVLRPFIDERQRARIRALFVEFLREAVPRGSECILRVSGPSDEEDVVMECLRRSQIEARYSVGERRSLEADIGDTIVNADLDAWANRALTELSDFDDV